MCQVIWEGSLKKTDSSLAFIYRGSPQCTYIFGGIPLKHPEEILWGELGRSSASCLRHWLDVTCQHLRNFQARPLPLAKHIWQMDAKNLLFKDVWGWGCVGWGKAEGGGVVVEKTFLL